MDTRLKLEDGLFELPRQGEASLWLWAQTCSDPRCTCRVALMLSAAEDREELLRGARLVHAASLDDKKVREVARALGERFIVFEVDLDTADVAPLDGPSDRSGDPRLEPLLAQIDDEILEDLARLWYRSKGWPDPEEERSKAKTIQLKNWQPGEMVSWGELMVGVRLARGASCGRRPGWCSVDSWC